MNKLRELISSILSGGISFDKEGWITMNGTPVKVDDAGEAVAGPSNVTGQSTGGSEAGSITITGDELGSYSSTTELRQKAVQYYKDNLQGKPSHREDVGEIRYSQKGIRETTHFSADPDKLLMLPAVRDIIDTGTLGAEEELKHPRKDGIVSFTPVTKTVNFKGKPREVEILLGKDRQGNLYYDLFLDNRREKGSPASGAEQNLRLAGDSTPELGSFVDINTNVLPAPVNSDRIAFDRASQRHFDENGFLHVAMCNISKEAVNDYYGAEIPEWSKLGLDPNRVYKGYRPADELRKAVSTFNGLNILSEHIKDGAENPPKDYIIGSMGTDANFATPYLRNSLIIKDAEAIELLHPADPEQTPKREISASYRYEPIFKSGTFNNQRYDFIMTNIRGNHIALVEEGRAGSDVVVSDQKTVNTKRGINMNPIEAIKEFLAKLEAMMGSGGGEGVEPPATDNEPGSTVPPTETAEDDALEGALAELYALADSIQDEELAAKIKTIGEAIRAAGGTASDEEAEIDPENKVAEDSDPDEEEKDKPAMDKKAKPKLGSKPAPVVVAMDAATIAKNVEAKINAKIQAIRECRPLIGDVDPMAFDSAAGIYRKALEVAGHPTKVSAPLCLR